MIHQVETAPHYISRDSHKYLADGESHFEVVMMTAKRL